MKVLIAGDFAPVSHRLMHQVSEGNFAEIFGDIPELIKSADFSIVNFEAPIADKIIDKKNKIQKIGPHLCTTPNAIKALKWCGFNLLTLANNHILDYGEKGILETLKRSEQEGLETVGAGNNLKSAQETKFVRIGQQTLAIINCCEKEFSIASDNTAGANPLDPISQFHEISEAKKKADFVLVIVHGGHEYCQFPSFRMKKTYRFFIDAGADAVVNHHQHCFSGYEIYNSRPIVYGLGNFCFDEARPYNPALWNHGYLAQIQFSNAEIKLDIKPYVQYGNDPCVQLLKDTSKFDEQIRNINTIIADPVRLENELKDFYLKNDRNILLSFEPYRNRFLRSAYLRKLLPSFLNKRRLRELLHLMNCESHYDKLRAILSYSLKETEK